LSRARLLTTTAVKRFHAAKVNNNYQYYIKMQKLPIATPKEDVNDPKPENAT